MKRFWASYSKEIENNATLWCRLVLCFTLLIVTFFVSDRRTLLALSTIICSALALSFVLGVRSQHFAKQRLFIVISLGLIFWICLSSRWSINTQALQISLVYVFTFVLFVSLYDIFTLNKKLITAWLTLYSVSLSACALYYVWHFLSASSLERFQLGRIIANPTATLFFPIIFFAFYRLMKIKKMCVPFTVWLSILLLSLICLILTFSRLALLSFVIGLLFYFLCTPLRWSIIKRLSIVVGFILGISLFGAFLAHSSSQFSSRNLIRISGYNFAERKAYSSVAWSLFAQRPVFGQGVGSFSVLSAPIETNLLQRSINAHNTPLQLASEFGVVGIGILTLLAVLVIESGLKIRHDALGVCVTASLLATALHFCFDVQLEYPLLLFVLASQVAMILAIEQSKKSSKAL